MMKKVAKSKPSLFGLALLAIGIIAVKALGGKKTPIPTLAHLRGVITDAKTGQAVAKTSIAVNGGTAITDAEGYYEIVNLKPGGYSVIIRKEAYTVSSKDITLVVGDNILDVKLTPVVVQFGRLLGRVTDAKTGLPIGGVGVALWDSTETEELISTTTKSDGTYLIPTEIWPGSYTVIFQKAGYLMEKR